MPLAKKQKKRKANVAPADKKPTRRQLEVASTSIDTIIKKPFLNEEEVQSVTGRKVATLRNDRHEGRGIPYLKVGKRAVMYRLFDVLTFMQARPITFEVSE